MNFISKDNLVKLLSALNKDYQVFVPTKKANQRFFKKYTDSLNEVIIGEVRTFEPLKAFFTRARETVAQGFKNDIPSAGAKPVAIIAAEACDLKGFQVQDYVFKNHDYQDPFYIRAREQNLIISADCTCTIETCFCLSLAGKPYPHQDFDLNLSPVNEGFVVEIGSEKGRRLQDKHTALFSQAKQQGLTQKDDQRNRVTKQVQQNIKKNNIPHQDQCKDVIQKKFAATIWEDQAKTCVECAACNTICPTCHCFLLYDQKVEQQMARLRIWDSCMIKDFAQVAGGANPRARLWMRLRNRFEKKFDYFPKVADTYACTGCGRCISACPAKIDIRDVLKRLVNE